MTIASEITRLQTAKANIKTSIENKGVTVPSATTLDGYPTLIDSIPQSGIIPSGTMAITSNGTYDVTNYASASVNIVGSSYTKLADAEYTISTTSTSTTLQDTIVLPRTARNTSVVYYVCVRDKAGARNGYFLGSDQWFIDHYTANSATTAESYAARLIWRYSSSSYSVYSPENTTGYGVYASSLAVDSGSLVVKIFKRYNSSYSTTINGTYSVGVYELTYPTGVTSVFGV